MIIPLPPLTVSFEERETLFVEPQVVTELRMIYLPSLVRKLCCVPCPECWRAVAVNLSVLCHILVPAPWLSPFLQP